MSFNPDISKQAQEVIFFTKPVKASYPAVFFYDIPVAGCSTHKDLGMYLDEKLNFGRHIAEKIKSNKGIGLIKTLHNFLSRRALTIYKCFIRPNLDYGDFIYDQPNNQTKQFWSKIESVQYNAALAITSAIRETSQTKLYRELGLEPLRSRQWFRRLCTLYKNKTRGLPPYLNNVTKKQHIIIKHEILRNWLYTKPGPIFSNTLSFPNQL